MLTAEVGFGIRGTTSGNGFGIKVIKEAMDRVEFRRGLLAAIRRQEGSIARFPQ